MLKIRALKPTPPIFMHFMHPTGSRRDAPTWSRYRSARYFVFKYDYKTSKNRGGGLISNTFLNLFPLYTPLSQ
jgi:hypothetical protein